MKVSKKFVLTIFLLPLFVFGEGFKKNSEEKSYISGEYIPYLFAEAKDDPDRTAPFFGLGEDYLGDKFLGNGNLAPGFEIPGGAVWQPRLWFYGTYRSSFGSYDAGAAKPQSEWANRLDLFANLQLTGTERILIGVEPFNRDDDFLGQKFSSNETSDFENPLNLRVRTLFFEGDLAELLPGLDPNDFKGLDIGLSLGRQRLVFQDGLLINDIVDAIGLTKNNLRFEGLAWLNSLRVSVLYGWNEVHRNDNAEDEDARIYALLTAADTSWSTLEADVIYVDSENDEEGDLLTWGFGSTSRVAGDYNLTLRYLGSQEMSGETPQSGSGQLFFSEVSFTPKASVDLVYWNSFVGLDDFTSAARGETNGGPLGRIGLLFAARNIGNYPAPINNRANNAFGTALGYQMFFSNNRRHVIIEAAYKRYSDNATGDVLGLAVQLQQALGKRYIIQFDTFILAEECSDINYGFRGEFLVKF
ncbi:MAG: hypothetical protein HRT88_18175 [Lentisphaeraceae bacterium]|nr:hypothetical protein [Lentisphaeraceae bacterium]